jgi:hypothetical protein
MAKAQYPLTITGVDNGFAVTAGCMTLVFEDSTKLLGEIAAWLSNPAEVETKYLAKYRGAPEYADRIVDQAEPAGFAQGQSPTTPHPGYRGF